MVFVANTALTPRAGTQVVRALGLLRDPAAVTVLTALCGHILIALTLSCCIVLGGACDDGGGAYG
jgi:hypothetical protein